MSIKIKKLLLLVGLTVFTLTNSGCVAVNKAFKVKPSMSEYVFLEKIEPVDEHYRDLYDEKKSEEPMLAAKFTEPDGFTIKFHGNPPVVIGEPASKKTGDPRIFMFREGVYPFSLYDSPKDKDWFSGVLVVYDIDETVELATFGESEDTQLFNLEMVHQAQEGVLAQYAISFDEKEVMRYWLGNRDNLYPGGRPTVEVDFSETINLESIKIDGKKIKGLKHVLSLDKSYVCSLCETKQKEANDFKDDCKESESGRHLPYLTVTHKNYPFEMTTTDGQRFQGYIKNLVTNVFTAFVSIPCEIPTELFDNAARGTISKLTVHSPDDDEQDVAEIVFGLAK